ncbi:MAG TPA: family 16 glycoside hydrolase [Pirellulales bacterium]|nr:family 16 glycoside hydrolase [Pirellulales bacterium]
MRIHLAASALAVVALLSPSLQAAQELTLGSLFSDHAVLQRDMPVPVWGKAEPGQQVVVQFATQEKKATADKVGRWMVKLDPMPASAEGKTLTVKSEPDGEKLARQDVLVGEVWACSGQSNMAMNVGGASNGPAAIAAAGDPQLRMFAAAARGADEPQDAIGGNWTVDSPQSAGGFSAVGYFFGQELRKKLGVPVGLIRSAVGGTVAESWTARAELESNPTLKHLLDQQDARVTDYPRLLAAYKEREPELLAKHEEEVAKAKAAGSKEPGKPQPPQDPATNHNRPTGLYNGSIAPLVPFAIRGAIWYQGEANAGRGKEYQTLFPAMIASWRRAWGQGDFPFLFVQIAPHNGMTPEIREAQRLTTETTPNTAMAVTTDVGDAADIHPKQKQPVGIRLATAARALAYGEPIEYSGPTLDGMTIAGNRAILTFKHLGGGLVAKDGDLKGFTIAGADGAFVDAKATIEGDTAVVSSEAVPAPIAVRYGWAKVPDVNLFNKADLPASPFQTEKVFELEPGFELLFNGKDPTGWHYDGAPFDGKTESSDGRYTARDGKIVVNPGKGLAQLRTMRELPHDFQLKLEFRAGVNADSGIFLRGPQLQCRDYLVAGPYKDLKNYKPQDWNEIEVTVKGDTATCTCNGEPLKFDRKLPPTGPIGLEADRGQMEYRRIRVKESP